MSNVHTEEKATQKIKALDKGSETQMIWQTRCLWIQPTELLATATMLA